MAQTFAAEGQEGQEGDGQVGADLQRDVDDGLHAFGVCLDHLPGFAVGDVLVADACQVHGLLLCLAELEVLQQVFQLLLHILELSQGLFVEVHQLAAGRHHALIVFLRQLQRTVHEVSVHGH